VTISQERRDCPKCERTYPEYVNGCPEDHEPPVSVELVMEVQR
jgi:hypothetical protein